MKRLAFVCSLLLLASAADAVALDGDHLHGAGTVNQSLGGAGAGGNVDDVAGTVHLNPACAADFPEGFSLYTGVEYFVPDRTLKSGVAGTPFTDGETRSSINAATLPTIAIIYRPTQGRTSFHFGLIPTAGGSVEYPKSDNSANPLLSAQAGRGGMGFGKIESQYEFAKAPIGLSCRLNQRWNVGASVIPSVSRFKLTPAAFAAPDDANQDGTSTYPSADDLDTALGIAFQGGVQFKATDRWSFGFSATTPTWFNDFEYEASNEIGVDRHLRFNLDAPAILTLGTVFQATEKTRLLFDVKWLDYAGTDGMSEGGVAPDGSVRGFGWDSQWVFSVGVQQDLTKKLALRLGYNFCTQNLPDDQTFFNVASPTLNQHHLAVGTAYRLTEKATLELGYYHVLSETQDSPWYDSNNQPVAGTWMESEVHVDSFSLGVTWKF